MKFKDIKKDDTFYDNGFTLIKLSVNRARVIELPLFSTSKLTVSYEILSEAYYGEIDIYYGEQSDVYISKILTNTK